jgi:hypothetical protein
VEIELCINQTIDESINHGREKENVQKWIGPNHGEIGKIHVSTQNL